MRQKLLLFLMMVSFGALNAQTDTIWSLIISEARFDRADAAYVELTNMGDEAVNLGEFEVVSMNPWTTFPDGAFWPDAEPPRGDGRWTMLPEQSLAPGESFVIHVYMEWFEEQKAKDIARFGYSQDHGGDHNKAGVLDIADLVVHRLESPTGDETDSVSDFNNLLESWGGGRDVIFLRHHPPDADSCTVDFVNGWFSDTNGSNPDPDVYRAVAGVPRATGTCAFIRQFDVKRGHRYDEWVWGNDLDESEWIPIPLLNVDGNDTWDNNRKLFWTLGNHQDTRLNDQTLTSPTIDIDWTNHVMTVPYGVRNNDSIMSQFDKVPGIAWHYDFNEGENSSVDSAHASVRTGDTLTIYAAGNTLEMIKFHLVAAPPTADANWVIPKKRRDFDGDGGYGVMGEVYEVSHLMMEGVLDTISEIPYAERTDSLMKYLEKPAKASWEFVWVDGNPRTDLMMGDKLKVTAEDGSVKEYYLKLQKYRKGREARLSAITWPDNPLPGLFDWKGDTIPFFKPSDNTYKISLPPMTEGIPALVAKNMDDNARHSIKRATNIFGSEADRTITITSTAENDTVVEVYNITLEKALSPDDLQPWNGETFISQYVFREDWSNNFLELVNPGNQVMEMSNYMIYGGGQTDPALALAIDGTGEDDFTNRYVKYIPGYKWEDDQASWDVMPYKAVLDDNVNATVFPGNVFVMGNIASSRYDDPHVWADRCDIDFANNPWGIEYTGNNCTENWNTINIYVWKILNPDVLAGTKSATDPADFELVDVWSMGDGTQFAPTGTPSDQCSNFRRKPDVYKGNTEAKGSFGDTEADSEWTLLTRGMLEAAGYGWPNYHRETPRGIDSHFMNDVTVYRSTVSSVLYLVTRGYSMEEGIRGVVTGTTAQQVWDNLITHPGQTWVVKSGGTAIATDAAVKDGDVLEVTSADGMNTSGYILSVTAGGLSDNAVLTSSAYTVNVDGATGTVSGMAFGDNLKTVRNGVTVPAGASLTIVDADDKYVPFKRLNFDTVYVDVQVTDAIYFDVVAEDGATKIKYQLTPNAAATDAWVYSDVYMVDQDKLLISLVPKWMDVDAFLANLVPSTGASLQLYDKLGYERNVGEVQMDDKLVVTSQDGSVQTTYYLTILNEIPNYLAYVLSDVYLVDEDQMTITGVDAHHTVATFKGNVIPAEGATMEVQNSGGSAKADADDMAQDDMLQVTAGNGVNVVTYTISVIVGIEDMDNDALSIYPNPTSGMLNIANAEIGSRVRVYNAVGSAVADVEVTSGLETISLDGHSAGMYFVTISMDNEVSGTYKVIKQ